MKVTLFCGGRGNGNLIKELVLDTDIELTLIVNAYDDGLSTGEIRKLMPGMLGPSDFRKNLGYLLAPASESHRTFSRILEHRLSLKLSNNADAIEGLQANINHSLALKLISLDEEFKNLFSILPERKQSQILTLFESFLDEVQRNTNPTEVLDLLNYQDFAVGNILLAGAYIQNEKSFSRANDYICSLFDVRARLLNISDENRYLIGLTSNGECVSTEADIVAGKFGGKLVEIFLVSEKISNEVLKNFNLLQTHSEKLSFLRNLESIPDINPLISDVLEKSEIVIYGSGTQHSSLFPTYKLLAHHNIYPTKPAKRIFVSNLDHDSDITDWSGNEILNSFSRHFGGKNYSDLIETIIVDEQSSIKYENLLGDIDICSSSLRSSRSPGAHDGRKLSEQIFLSLLSKNELEVEIRIFTPGNVLKHSRMWHLARDFDLSASPLIAECKVFEVQNSSKYAVDHFNEWISDNTRSRFLVLFACEGETKFSDFFAGIELMKAINAPVLNGSRTQSRRQWHEATSKTYGEGKFRFGISIAATLITVFACMIRRKQLLTDPLSRCLIFDRLELKKSRSSSDVFSGKTLPGLRTFLLQKNVDVVEFPITYRVFKGYKAFVNPTKDAIGGILEIMKLPK